MLEIKWGYVMESYDFAPCAECSKALNATVVHTGEQCKPGQSAFAVSSEEYEEARKFFGVSIPKVTRAL